MLLCPFYGLFKLFMNASTVNTVSSPLPGPHGQWEAGRQTCFNSSVCANTSAAGPSTRTRPLHITTTRSKFSTTNFMSWEMVMHSLPVPWKGGYNVPEPFITLHVLSAGGFVKYSASGSIMMMDATVQNFFSCLSGQGVFIQLILQPAQPGSPFQQFLYLLLIHPNLPWAKLQFFHTLSRNSWSSGFWNT